MALETLKITELELECYVLEKVPPQMGKSPNVGWRARKDSNLRPPGS